MCVFTAPVDSSLVKQSSGNLLRSLCTSCPTYSVWNEHPVSTGCLSSLPELRRHQPAAHTQSLTIRMNRLPLTIPQMFHLMFHPDQFFSGCSSACVSCLFCFVFRSLVPGVGAFGHLVLFGLTPVGTAICSYLCLDSLALISFKSLPLKYSTSSESIFLHMKYLTSPLCSPKPCPWPSFLDQTPFKVCILAWIWT